MEIGRWPAVTTMYIGTIIIITFIKAGSSAMVRLLDNIPSPALSAEAKLRKRFITINGTHFNVVGLFNEFNNVVSFDIVTMNSTFTYGSAFQFRSALDTDRYYIRHWRMTGCTFSNSSFYLLCKYTQITIIDDVFVNMLNDDHVTTGIMHCIAMS